MEVNTPSVSTATTPRGSRTDFQRGSAGGLLRGSAAESCKLNLTMKKHILSNRFPVVFGLILVPFLTSAASSQEMSGQARRALESAKRQDALSARKMMKIIRLNGDYPYVSSIRPVVEDVWTTTIVLNIKMKPSWTKLSPSKKRNATQSLFKLWESFCSMQSPPSDPWIRIYDSRGRKVGEENTGSQ